MDTVSGIVVYILLWWWVFFMTLPFGARQPEEVEAGHADGAPVRPMLWIKAGITTILALVLWFVVDAVITSGVFSFREMVSK